MDFTDGPGGGKPRGWHLDRLPHPGINKDADPGRKPTDQTLADLRNRSYLPPHLPRRPDRRPGGPIATPPGPDTTNSRAARGTGEARQDSVVNSSRSIWWTVRSGMALLRIMDRRPSESGDGHSRLSTGAGGPSRAILQSRTGADAIHIMTVTAQARR
jgi:hypothetical protein